MEQREKILQNTPFFAGIEKDKLEAVLSWLDVGRRTCKKGEVLFQNGDDMPYMGLVLKGSLYLEKEDFWGNRSILAIVGEGEAFGEVYACLKKRKLNLNVIAAEVSEVLFLDIEKVLEEEAPTGIPAHKLTRNLLEIFADKNYILARKTEYLSKRTTREKLLSYLSAQAQTEGAGEFVIPFNRQELADFLSVDRSALSRELGKMQEEGILQFKKNRFCLTDGTRVYFKEKK